MINNILIIIFSIILSSTAHVLLKKGVSAGSIRHWQDAGVAATITDTVFNLWIVGGMLLHVCALVVWLWALSRVDISFAYPFLALGYVLVGIMAWWWLGESMTLTRIGGMLIIIIGLVVLSKGG